MEVLDDQKEDHKTKGRLMSSNYYRDALKCLIDTLSVQAGLAEADSKKLADDNPDRLVSRGEAMGLRNARKEVWKIFDNEPDEGGLPEPPLFPRTYCPLCKESFQNIALHWQRGHPGEMNPYLGTEEQKSKEI